MATVNRYWILRCILYKRGVGREMRGGGGGSKGWRGFVTGVLRATESVRLHRKILNPSTLFFGKSVCGLQVLKIRGNVKIELNREFASKEVSEVPLATLKSKVKKRVFRLTISILGIFFNFKILLGYIRILNTPERLIQSYIFFKNGFGK